ncbi:MAG: 3-phosphoserine/phosphohydroxythreonine transaminase [Acidobacteria bacterium]|nr:3-phosphoserine/phosphohydroxythreonine transaminase [Acidobacteriota bacterium]
MTRPLPHDRVYNFSAGPAMLPEPVMLQIREEFLNFSGLGASIIEISHRSKEFDGVVEQAIALFRELTGLSENYHVLFVHGGGRMQFSAVPMNLLGGERKKALYVETDTFSSEAINDAAAYGEVKVIASGKQDGFSHVPAITRNMVDPDAAYLHITTNNTTSGTCWKKFPGPDVRGQGSHEVPLVGDSTSEILSRVVDYTNFGVVFAGLQKNLGPSGTAIVIIRKDLCGKAQKITPPLLNYATLAEKNSMLNTPSTFNIYVAKLVMEWIKKEGGLAAIELRNNEKIKAVYDVIDASKFYTGVVQPAHRSHMNATFRLTPGAGLPSEELTAKFVKEANQQGLYALTGYRTIGGIRASMYNAMPLAGAQALASFMKEFERKNG